MRAPREGVVNSLWHPSGGACPPPIVNRSLDIRHALRGPGGGRARDELPPYGIRSSFENSPTEGQKQRLVISLLAVLFRRASSRPARGPDLATGGERVLEVSQRRTRGACGFW